MSKTLFASLFLALLAAPAAAEKKEKDKNTPAAVAKQISKAIGKGDASEAKAAFAVALSSRDRYDDKQMMTVAKAVGKGIGHKDADLALASIETLGKLKVTGSSKYLGALLKPPPKVTDDKLPLHVAALEATGSIHDPASLPALQKLLLHPHADIATAAAGALPPYKVLDLKPKMALVKKLIGILEKLETDAAKAKKDEDKARAEKVRAALVEAMQSVTAEKGPTTAAEWKAWAKKAAKERV